MSEQRTQSGPAGQSSWDEESHWLAIARRLSDELATTIVERERNNTRPIAEIERLKQLDLLNLVIPKAYGGHGQSLHVAAQVIQELAKGDVSIAMLLAFHYKHVLMPQFLDYVSDGESILRQSAANNWFWGNITGTWDLAATPTSEGGYVINGTKKMCTGASVSDVVALSARRADLQRNRQVHFFIPTSNPRLINHGDWSSYPGVKLTETHTYTVDNLEVSAEAVIPHSGEDTLESFPRFYSEYGLVIYSALLLGSAQGALQSALQYTRQKGEPRLWAGVPDPLKDPLILHSYGNFVIKLAAAQALFDKVSLDVSDAWQRRRELSNAELTAIAVGGHSLRVFCADTGLEVSSRIFDVTGARSLSGQYGLDRYWRDIRTLSTHEPFMYWVRNIGDYTLNGAFTKVQFNAPTPTPTVA